MADLGFGAGGVAEAMQLIQSLQTGKIDQQQRQVALETSQLQLENLKKLQASLGSQAFQGAMSGADPQAQNRALTQLADVYLANNMPNQAKAVIDMATNMATSRAYVTEQQAMASQKYITMAEDLFAGVSNPQEWAAAQQFMQSQLPPEALQSPIVKGLLTSGYSPDKVRILPQFFERLKTRAQIMADEARAGMEDAHKRYYDFEERKDLAQADEAESRADYYRQHGGGALVPDKEEISAVANDLQARYPEAEAEPVVSGGKLTDPAAMRSNYKARIQARATDIAETAKAYTRQGMKPQEARRKAIEEADARGDLSTLKAPPGASAGTPATSPPPPARTSSESWGEPTTVSQ
jgi:hypothetical protein